MVTLDVPVDRIAAEARQVNPAQAGRLLLTLLMGLFYLIGYVPRVVLIGLSVVLGALWVAAVWSGTAVKVGWQDGGKRAQRR